MTTPSDPQQEEQPDVKEGKVIADYELDIDYDRKGSEPENEPHAQEQRDQNSDIEYANM